LFGAGGVNAFSEFHGTKDVSGIASEDELRADSAYLSHTLM